MLFNKKRDDKPKKKMPALDKYVIFCFIVLLIYTIVHTVVVIITGIEASVLTTCFFAAFGGEVFACALIKRLKLKKGDSEDEKIDK